VLNEEQKQELAEILANADPSAGIVILPERRLANGMGVYDEAMTDLVKELKAEGVAVVWGDEPEQRSADSQRSFDQDTISAIIGFPWGVASNAAWEAIKLLFSRPPRDTRELEVELATQTSSEGDAWTWATFKGNGAAVTEAMAAYLERTNDAAK
jgi:hypothetical protein